MKFSYIKSPEKIYEASFAHIQKKLPTNALAPYTSIERAIILRMIHACGSINTVLHNIRFSPAFKQIDHTQLKNTPILCDTHMIQAGLLPAIKKNTQCYIKHQKTIEYAKQHHITRAMAAMHLQQKKIPQSILLIANAPTALFYLLEIMLEQSICPKLIIGMPVGFISAKESKQALWSASQTKPIPTITLAGHQGGSALVSAAANALINF